MKSFLVWFLCLSMALPVLPGPMTPAYAEEEISASEAVSSDAGTDDESDSETVHEGMTDDQKKRHLQDRYMYHLFFDPHPVVIGSGDFFSNLFRKSEKWKTWEINYHGHLLESYEPAAPFLEMGERFLRWYLERMEVSFVEYEPWLRTPTRELIKAAERPHWVVEERTVKPTEREAAQRAWEEVVDRHNLDPDMEYQELLDQAATNKKMAEARDDYNRLFFLFLDEERIEEHRVDEFKMETYKKRITRLLLIAREQNLRSAMHYLHQLGGSEFVFRQDKSGELVTWSAEDFNNAEVEFVANGAIDFTHRFHEGHPWKPGSIYEQRTGIKIKGKSDQSYASSYLTESEPSPAKFPHYGVRFTVKGQTMTLTEKDYLKMLAQLVGGIQPGEEDGDEWFWLQRFVAEAGDRDSGLAFTLGYVASLNESYEREELIEVLRRRLPYHVLYKQDDWTPDSSIHTHSSIFWKLQYVNEEYLEHLDPVRKLYWYGMAIHPRHWKFRQEIADYETGRTLQLSKGSLYASRDAIEAMQGGYGWILSEIEKARDKSPLSRMRFEGRRKQLAWFGVHGFGLGYKWSEGLYGTVEMQRLADEKKQLDREIRKEQRRQNWQDRKDGVKDFAKGTVPWIKRLLIAGALAASGYFLWQTLDDADLVLPQVPMPSIPAPDISLPDLGIPFVGGEGEQEMSSDDHHYQMPQPQTPHRLSLSDDDDHYQVDEGSPNQDPFASGDGTFRVMAFDESGQRVSPPTYYNSGASFNLPEGALSLWREFDALIPGLKKIEIPTTRTAGAHVLVGNTVPFETERGYVPILQPDHHNLVSLEVRVDGELMQPGVDYVVYRVSENGLLYLSFPGNWIGNTDGVKYQAQFQPTTVNYDTDGRWDLSASAMMPVIQDLADIGATELATALLRLAESSSDGMVSLRDFETTFFNTGMYSYRPSTGRSGDRSNPFYEATRYLDRASGVFLYQCTASNFVLETFLEQVYLRMGRSNISVGSVNGYVLKNEDGHIGPAGHRRTLLSDTSDLMTYTIVDGTPYTMDPENEETDQGRPGHHPLPEAEQKYDEEQSAEEEQGAEEETAEHETPAVPEDTPVVTDSENDPVDEGSEEREMLAINRRYRVPDNPALEIPYRYTPSAPKDPVINGKPVEPTIIKPAVAETTPEKELVPEEVVEPVDEEAEAVSEEEEREVEPVVPKRRNYQPEIDRIKAQRKMFRDWLDRYYKRKEFEDEEFQPPALHADIVPLFQSLELVDEFFSYEITRTEFLSRLIALSAGQSIGGEDAIKVYSVARRELIAETGSEGKAISFLMGKISSRVSEAIQSAREEMSSGEMPEHFYLLETESRRYLVNSLIQEFEREWFSSLVHHDDCDALMLLESEEL